MILLYQVLCLGITLYVLQKYITSGAYSRRHRLLPLLLGMFAVYNFYEVVLTLTGETALFTSLKGMLVIQVFYLLLFYVMDFLNVRCPDILEGALFTVLLLMNLLVFLRYEDVEFHRTVFLGFVIAFLLAIIITVTYAYLKYSFTEREGSVTRMFYLMLFSVVLSIAAEETWETPGNLLLLTTLAFVCICIHYLVQTNQLLDTGCVLQENLFENSDTAMVLFDADYCYVSANRVALSFFRDELGNLTREKRMPRPYTKQIREMTKAMDRRREVEKNGCYYQCQLTPVYHEGNLRGYVLTLWDITAQKKETQLMSALRGRAETQTALKSDFLARMSHDLRSPLHAIIGISDILSEKRGLSARNRSMVSHIKRAGNVLLEQVDAILDYSRLESGRLELANMHYQLHQVLGDLAHMCVINLQSKPVEFTMEVKEPFPCEFEGDPLRVREIIQNLLMNAIKFTESGEIRCELFFETESDSYNTRITCKVSDTGAGMTKERIDEVFGEYVTFGGESNPEGVGLGLCIVKQLSELMGGNVSAKSDGVSGTTITAVFYQRMLGEKLHSPVRYTREDILRQTVNYTRRVFPTWVYPKARVLLADDMEINQEIFKELAAPWQFTVDAVRDGREAVAAVRREKYQLIFLDQMMPEMTGDAAADMIGEICDAPMILMTADLPESVKTQKQHGFTDFLGKPIDIGDFQRIIEQYMPKDYRKDFLERSREWEFARNASGMRAYRRTLQTFVKEVAPLAEALPGFVPDNLVLLRAKVHGIKGAGRQIGRYFVSEQAEIMEMAAETENISFLESHMQDFIEALYEAVEDVEQEINKLPKYADQEAAESTREAAELFAELKAGFDAYDLGRIESSIRGLTAAELTPEEKTLLEEARAACEELAYERGSRLFGQTADATAADR